jgi:transcriptional regulator with PAS, ATPase and Fis domain
MSLIMEEKQPWVTCYLTDMLLGYVREVLEAEGRLDYPALFRGAEGFDIPSDLESYLSDVDNWVPLTVLRELELQCEEISGKKDVAYHAAKTYFAPGRRQWPSLFEIIVRILNDVRSALMFASLWGSSQTNYLKLQSFERPGSPAELYILSQFSKPAEPAIGTLHLLRGFCEGFPRLYPFIEQVQCAEEISQLRIEEVVREFPDFLVRSEADSLMVCRRSSKETVMKAAKIRLATERIDLPPDFVQNSAAPVVIVPQHHRIEVLTSRVTESSVANELDSAYQVVQPGVVSHGPLSHAFAKNQIYNAAYSRFRVIIKENATQRRQAPESHLRKEISRLLFEHLQQSRQAQARFLTFNVEKGRLTLENARLRREVQRENSFAGVVGQSKQMQDLFSLIRAVADTDVTVLVLGETGTGKELIARAIHYNSARKNKPFVAVNCGALSLTLLESELFGHEKGAFTGAVGQKKGFFEVANGGTLFLDEIGEIPTSTQVKLLRVLQESELQRVGGTDTIKVDVRIIAATNQNLEERIAKREFRQDLYYRLKVFPLTVPSLRERVEDIPLLVSHFIEKCSQVTKRSVKEITPEAMGVLMAHDWPGNIRELENVIQRMMVVSKGEFLDLQDLPPEMRAGDSPGKAKSKGLKGISRGSAELIEKRTIIDALAKTGGNVTHAAKELGISRATLQTKMKAYGLRETKA